MGRVLSSAPISGEILAMLFRRRLVNRVCRSLVVALLTGEVFAATPESEALVKEGTATYKKGDRTGAVKIFTQAIAADGSNVLAYYNRGRIQEVLSNFEEAYADYNALLRLKP